MGTAIIVIILMGFVFIMSIIGFMMFADKWLRGVDKEKYLTKSLKKQLKKGNLTDSEFEEKQGILRK